MSMPERHITLEVYSKPWDPQDEHANFKQEVATGLEAGSPANVTAFSLVGFLADLAKKGHMTPLDDDVKEYILNTYAAPDSWIKYGTAKGPDGKDHFYGVVFQTYINSLIYYSPENFEDAGYKVPQTFEELKALEDQIVADGETPWCHGLFAEGSTGFTGGDMMEDILLRREPIEFFDKLYANETRLDDLRIQGAMQELGQKILSETKVDGGPKAVESLDWRTAAVGIFSNPPKCYMYHQGSYVTSYLPKTKKFGEWDFFYFPPVANRPDLAKSPAVSYTHLTLPTNREV